MTVARRTKGVHQVSVETRTGTDAIEARQRQHAARAGRQETRFVVKSWGAPPKNLGVRIGNGATRRLTIYAFDPSISQHVVILVKELASRITAVRT